MPLLVAIDELSSALAVIEAHSRVALESGNPQQMHSALMLIAKACEDADETVSNALGHAVKQMAEVMTPY